MSKRTATIKRETRETQIEISLCLDGSGKSQFSVEIPFLAHMLEQVVLHGFIDMDLQATGDLDVDAHHSVEDIGIVFGQAVAKALGDKIGIARYGHAYVPLDESLSRVVLDFSGRPGCFWHVQFPRERVGSFDTELFQEFFRGFANGAAATLHVDNLRGSNSHHIAETIFKAFGRALRMALAIDSHGIGILPSTKGVL
uniref:Imidazoleglycerol-phosphate dehydratase n=1 Tax=Candidatus Kentrum sp. TUN TaxID=2126343 RepID=A0A451AKN2_9GAMM|nr:MAG: imidazoleglycerol-phosphate dehydratase [Candidatus Kentron sp. TUN]VFK57896.1 MAG: imidazoleglycerol-phosphate dehydratase [Candidatus Kentron sp. TUN]VFK66589.1 MAG: imidazoleglycerol-phosphate dehydratase [Candidatus Kentron sp. TUN]